MSGVMYAVDDLLQLATACFQAAGVTDEDARWTAQVLVRADLQGTATHGLSRLSAYVSGICNGKIKPQPEMKIDETGPATAVIDGDQGLGPVVGKIAMEAALDKAKVAGVGITAVRNGNHAGAMSTYTELAASRGCIGFALTNAQPAIPPWGGRKAYFGTNPIALAAPQKDGQPVSIDLATSVVARGNIIMAAKRNEPIPGGWAIDANGDPTTDAAAALKGALLPMAGPKGYSLALIVEILSGLLSGGNFGYNVGSIYDEGTAPPGTSMFFMALNPDFFIGQSIFETRVSQLAREVTSVPLASGHERIRMPGDRRQRLENERRLQGVPIASETEKELRQICKKYSITMPKSLAPKSPVAY
ncbi:Ldh family oxidoreductase [Alicyclobacillus mengziensis]|uniref:Ldh family oxidoreductase n=1 Tax=Alicyclobacillus mengziensis TaxID=2931921 RepID=A0A9X7Z5T2_9BACL|nr:Ldh family oxidoreductase [Alicyclobacillus mengziensis]QSO45601.1 Ldh family oxidoreductase [Alicyclobacillus mengziensis]